MCSINNRTKWNATLVMAAASLPLVSAAQGAVTYAFAQTTPYQALANATVSVPLYLAFDGADLTALIAGDGLVSAGTLITTLTAPANPALLAGFSGAALKFDGSVVVPDGAGGYTLDQSGSIFPASTARLGFLALTFPGGVGATGGRVYLGNLDFKAGTVVGKTTTFNAGILLDVPDFTSTAGAGSVNPVVFNTIGSAGVSVTVVPIPEPATALGLVFLASAGLLTRGQRRQRHQSTPK